MRKMLLAGVVMLLAVVVVWALTDPRETALRTIADQLATLRDSTPLLSDSVRNNITRAITYVNRAASGIPDLPDPQPTPSPTPSPSPTPTPSPTPVDPTVGVCGEPMDRWHAALVNGCAAGHEHGDPPQDWVTAWSLQRFGHGVIYGGDEASSPMENGMKHAGFKGTQFTTEAGGQGYLRYHAVSNPMDRSARYHSHEIYYRDATGAVSFFQRWFDTGTIRCVRRYTPLACENNRPVLLVADGDPAGPTSEQWYVSGPGTTWGWEFAVNILASTTWFRLNEADSAMDQSTWVLSGSLGLRRVVEAFWHGRDGVGSTIVGDFCSTAIGQLVACDAPGALPQYIAPSMNNDMRSNGFVQRIDFMVDRTYDGTGVHVPN